MNVLIAIDLTEHAGTLVDKTVELLAAAVGEIWLLHVAEPDPEFVGYGVDPPVMRDQLALRFHEEHRRLQDLAGNLRGRGLTATALLIQGETVGTILEQAGKLNADLVAVGVHAHGALYRLLLGDVGEDVLKKSARPVLAIPLD